MLLAICISVSRRYTMVFKEVYQSKAANLLIMKSLKIWARGSVGVIYLII